MAGGHRWWTREAHEARRPFLLVRARLAAAIRAHLSAEGFLEAEPAALQVSPGNEAHLHGFPTRLTRPDGTRRDLWLHTSPEFALKKLVAAGEPKLFALSRVFRDRERTALHAPEFTMLEWYRAGATTAALKDDCSAFLRLAAEAADLGGVLRHRGREADARVEPETLSVVGAFARHAGIDLERLLPARGEEPDRERFAAAAAEKGFHIAADDGWSDMFSRVLTQAVEPNLGIGRPVFLCDYPASEAALARPLPRDPRFAERFELYACGVELCNAFGELTDPHEQRRRFMLEMAEKRRVYGEDYPLDEDFLDALASMPEASGAALGFDRLVMLATGASRIAQVEWTPVVE